MEPLLIGGALAVLLVVGLLAWWRRRAHADQRRQWQGTRERDWTADELVALAVAPASGHAEGGGDGQTAPSEEVVDLAEPVADVREPVAPAPADGPTDVVEVAARGPRRS